MAQKKYFDSPEEAIPVLSELINERAFDELAAYYDLTGSGILREELESGRFFINDKKPAVAHPGGFWRYRHPFAPGFEFSHVRSTHREGIYVVVVEISIEQGVGSPVQRGHNSFYMRKTADGWQVLPEKPDAADEWAVPGIQ